VEYEGSVALEPDLLEALRSQSGLSIDDEGRFRHRGEPITHARTLEVLWSSLERREDGRYLVRIGRESGYVQVEDDAPYAVRGVTLEPTGPLAHLSDGSVEPLDLATVAVGADGVLRCRVKGRAHRARFTRAAQAALGEALVEDPSAPGGYSVDAGGGRHPLGRE
jgi:hypothetical protein